MGDKTAIERLRELLDEIGVKHVGNGGMTRWANEDGCVCRAYTRPGHLTVDVAIMDASPEQAIAATLGSDDRYDAGFANGVQALFQQLEGIESLEELQDFIAEYWAEEEGNDEP